MKKDFTSSKQTYKSIKSGLDTAAKYPDRPNHYYESMPMTERTERHTNNHPNDKNEPKTEKGIQWAKSKQTSRDKKLKEFYKTHVYTWISNSRRGWIAIPTGEEE
jgi:hypothetical protein